MTLDSANTAQVAIDAVAAALQVETSNAFMGGCLLNSVRVGHAEADLDVLAAQAEQAMPGSVSRVELPANKAELMEFVRKWEAENRSKMKLGAAAVLLLPLVACGRTTFSVTVSVPGWRSRWRDGAWTWPFPAR